MKKLFFIAAAGAGLVLSSCGGVSGSDLKTNQDSVSYCFGTMMATGIMQQLQQLPIDTLDVKYLALAVADSKPDPRYIENVEKALGEIDEDLFMAGFQAKLEGNELFPEAYAGAVLNKRAEATQREANKAAMEELSKNMAEGAAFLENNAKAEGVVTTESGLQYKVITEGEGAKPDVNDRVKAHYRGTLLDGTVFDESHGEPIEFSLDGVIAGWTEGLQLMSPGAKYEFYIPGELAYGERGAGDKIGPMQTLIFEVELVEVIPVP